MPSAKSRNQTSIHHSCTTKYDSLQSVFFAWIPSSFPCRDGSRLRRLVDLRRTRCRHVKAGSFDREGGADEMYIKRINALVQPGTRGEDGDLVETRSRSKCWSLLPRKQQLAPNHHDPHQCGRLSGYSTTYSRHSRLVRNPGQRRWKVQRRRHEKDRFQPPSTHFNYFYSRTKNHYHSGGTHR